MIIADIGEIASFKNFQIISIKCLLIFIFFYWFPRKLPTVYYLIHAILWSLGFLLGRRRSPDIFVLGTLLESLILFQTKKFRPA